jgi:phosphatidylinositol kinase/protein kinase (PI-3  family)
MINNLLKQKSSTRKKNLSIRTYKVVPLAPQAGIVQWVDGTKPFGEILLEAYSRYLRNSLIDFSYFINRIKSSWTPSVCREKMKTEQEKFGSTISSKLFVFQQISSHLPVIFGMVFFSLYRDPATWYQNRSKYMKSVATSSMGGYMLGVGDRHSQNLLFDEKTGEIIHIDLGIAFDQGKLLSTPETVPFRLTRNMIDAMGITKYEGEFKISCENTLQVLRDERDVLFTLLNVFRHDPLHTWTISPFKMKRIQLQDNQQDKQDADLDGTFAFSKTETEGNVEADIALFGINKKLSCTLSVECQVQELITTAIDPKNLCTLFHGWQSWI